MTNQISSSRCIYTESTSKSIYTEFGLPVAKGEFLPDDRLTLYGYDQSGSGNLTDCTIETRCYWPDGSPKWLDIRAVLQGNHSYRLITNPSTHLAKSSSIQSKSLFDLSENGIIVGDKSLGFYLSAQLKNGEQLNFIPSEMQSSNNTMREQVCCDFIDKSIKQLRFKLTITYSKLTDEYFIDLRIENTNTAIHPAGTWDLGDPNSIVFNHIELKVAHSQSDVRGLHVVDEDNLAVITFPFEQDSLQVSQFDSGGKNFRSPIHKNSKGKIPNFGHGYTVSTGPNQTYTGARAKPSVLLTIDEQPYCLCTGYFWQNFPSKLTVESNQTSFLFLTNDSELQPGESKGFSFNLASETSSTTEYFNDSLLPFNYDSDYLNNTGVFYYTELNKDNRLSSTINKGTDGDKSFLKKREVIDVYGWRNFGELYADHEAINNGNEDYFVSHYNNQYDALYGLLIQHLCSPEKGWDRISQPLASHVIDIDIYNTALDKPEYNGGLFWHTDHYLPAETCTHRTYSKGHHSVYEGHQGGGGPGGQHCYTTGLMLQATLLKNDVAQEKVLQLTNWVRSFYNGNGGILDRLYRFITIDLKPGKPTAIGIVKKGFRYPLDRGTGNYLTALIDCYELTQDEQLLTEMALVIKSTVGIGEDINERNLKDIEGTWFYTVFLQATIKFLLLKESLDQLDKDFGYALQVLNDFSTWMLKHEAPYLDNASILEFPNDTWVAQDVRKAVIFSYAAYFLPEKSERFMNKMNYFLSYIESKLADSPEAETTRILAILMQNSGAIEKALRKAGTKRFESKINIKPNAYSGQPMLMRLLTDLFRLIPKFSLYKEVSWVHSRFPNRTITLEDS